MAKWKLNFSGHDFDDYQEQAISFAIYSKNMGLAYTALGLVGEAVIKIFQNHFHIIGMIKS